MPDIVASTNKLNRPGWVWAISIFFLISAGYTILSFTLIYTGAISETPAQKAYISSLTLFDHSTTIAIAALNLLGTFYLFSLRKTAPYFFLAAFVIGLIVYAYQILTKNWLSAMGGPGLVGAALGQLLGIAILAYSYRLRLHGTLR